MFPRLGILIAALLAVAGCSKSPRQAAEARLRQLDVTRLRLDAAVLYKNMHASAGPTYVVIKPTVWPESFKAIGPSQVGAYLDGFTLTFEQTGGRESGLYVIPAQTDMVPQATARAHFDRIVDGIYWYSFEP